MAVLRATIVPLLSVVLALMVGGIIIALSGADPLAAYEALLQGSLGSTRGIERTLENATPLIFGGLAVALAFRAGLFNIGAQGQLLMGAISAAFAGFAITGLPLLLHAPLALLFGALLGALWGALAGILKAASGAHEVITTIMLNFIALNLTDFLANGPLKDPAPGNIIARTPAVAESATLPALGSVPLGMLLALLVAILVWWLIWKTTLGFELRMVGQNPHAARYAGISVGRIIVLAMFISGGLAGLGGAVETLGLVGHFQPGFTTGLGFTSITIALLGRTHPLGVIPAALLIGTMEAGANRMQFDSGVSPEIIQVIQALMLFFVAADIIIRTLLRMRTSDSDDIQLSSGWGQS
jgi:simple sugar transport system permease protein